MRVYYIFNIKKQIQKVSNDNGESLYKLLESIYYLDKKDKKLAFKTYNKICDLIDKKNLNKYIKEENIDNLSYTLFLNNHVINDFLNNEATKLTIYNSFIKIKSTSMYPTFFNTLKNIPNLFVCDFKNMDYFYLKDIINKVYTR